MPRSENSSPEPITRSLTVPVVVTSPGRPADSARAALWTAIALTGGVVVYAIGAAALGSTEVRGLLDMVRRRRTGVPPAKL